jgi:hypothetical protein
MSKHKILGIGQETGRGYIVGQVYFRLVYPDVEMHYPIIQSFVYLGMNFSDEDLEDTWYFQPARDFSQHGSAIGGFERPVSCATIEELGDFEDVSQLSLTLLDAAARRVAAKKHT